MDWIPENWQAESQSCHRMRWFNMGILGAERVDAQRERYKMLEEIVTPSNIDGTPCVWAGDIDSIDIASDEVALKINGAMSDGPDYTIVFATDTAYDLVSALAPEMFAHIARCQRPPHDIPVTHMAPFAVGDLVCVCFPCPMGKYDHSWGAIEEISPVSVKIGGEWYWKQQITR